jgi:hypothetical protein
METVFDCAIEYMEIDDTHNLLVVTALTKIVLYQVSVENPGTYSSSHEIIYP